MWIYDFEAKLSKVLSEERAQGMVEYTIIIALVAIISVAVFASDGGGMSPFNSINTLYNQTGVAIEKIEVPNVNQN
jgi:Flp pilus assembly pilin Flp